MVSESGLYHLVFRSSNPEAKAFRRWVTEQVLPSIRKTGSYSVPGATVYTADDQLRLLVLARGLVDQAWLEAKIRHVLARVLGEEPEIDPATRPLTVGEFLADKGVSGKQLRSMSPPFGKRLKALYRQTHHQEPGTTERFVDGALREVAGYTEADRPLFGQVWATMGVRALSGA
jgi:hypothetical protein